ncbi:MAG: anthranilate phosphoribosyltransferase [Clostridia bacterium]|nr:anthranilate phosphoribosyltransferase [Clostridia bacterium]MCL6521775.1 anthranilate phosphoribosyltransferase [Bacillota bacterium]
MLREALARVAAGERLSVAEAEAVIGEVMDGRASDAQIAALLTAMRVRGETPEEMEGAARAMRQRAARVERKRTPVVDTCGTGGDGAGTFNISTTAAFVVAGAGQAVAKHGNRSVSSRAGSADVLEALGVAVDLDAEAAGRCLDQAGIAFLFAPRLHAAMRHAAGPRRELGFRTIFNVLGPLTNPAGAEAQLVGVYEAALTEPVAEVLLRLGARHVLVVHSLDGLDELSTSAPARVTEGRGGRLSTYVLDPATLGLAPAPRSALRGGDAAENAAIAEAVLAGEPGPRRETVLLNAAAALVAADVAEDLREGLELARRSLDSGAARDRLEALRDLSRRLAAAREERRGA